MHLISDGDARTGGGGVRRTTMRAAAPSGDVEALVTSDGIVWTWKRLIEEFGPAVESYARARGVRDADDLAQDVFADVIQKMATFSGTSTDLRSFVFTVAFRRIADRHRRAYRQARLRPERVPFVEPDESVLNVDDGARAMAQLDRLDERSQAVLRLRFVQQRDIGEIAAVMNLSEANVRAIQSRALKRLRRTVQKARTAQRRGPLAMLAWPGIVATRSRLRRITGDWLLPSGGLPGMRRGLFGNAFGSPAPGLGAVSGSAVVAGVSLAAAALLAVGVPIAEETTAPDTVIVSSLPARAAGAAPQRPTIGSVVVVPQRPPAPPATTLAVDAGSSDAPTSIQIPTASSTIPAVVPGPASNPPAETRPDAVEVPGPGLTGTSLDRSPVLEVLASPTGLVEQLEPAVLASTTSELTTTLTDLRAPAPVDTVPAATDPVASEQVPSEPVLDAAAQVGALVAEVAPTTFTAVPAVVADR